jgi:glycosyltransferase involved in cell wall biosynthesis
MTTAPKVSVIIPVYNTEKYLRQCLDSVVNQTLKDIEIICINDGSTDKSLTILRDYASKDNRIVVINNTNEGAGASRNKGLEISNGTYLVFWDSDDFLSLMH